MSAVLLRPEGCAVLAKRAEALAAAVGLRLVREPGPAQFVLAYAGGALGLEQPGTGRRPVQVNLARAAGRAGPELVVRACRGGRAGLLVWDLTAGLGRDAAVLAGAGARVVMTERCRPVAALLHDGLTRLAGERAGLADRMSLIPGEARGLEGREGKPQVIYIDPMLEVPERSKTALVKREMQALQRLVGPGEPPGPLLDWACRQATDRVVLKRPLRAAVIGRPSHSLKGRRSRFDVYCARALCTSSDDPDRFRGPGGLSGRELFSAVQQSMERDAGGKADGAGVPRDRAGLSKMSAGELQRLLKARGVSTTDCVEKSQLVDRALKLIESTASKAK